MLSEHGGVPPVDAGPHQAKARMQAARPQLFRQESLDARRHEWLARSTLDLGLPARVSSVSSLLLAIAASTLVVFGSYTRREDLNGLVLPQGGLTQVTAPAAGRIESISVHNNGAVEKNDLLYLMNLDVITSSGPTQERILEAFAEQRELLLRQIENKQEMRAEQRRALEAKSGNLQDQIQQLKGEIAQKAEFVRTQTQNYADFTKFQTKGIGTLESKLARQQTWMRSMEEYQALLDKSLSLRGELIEAKHQRESGDLQAQSDVDALEQKLADIDQLVANADARRSIEVRAPVAGIVTDIGVHAGQIVTSGERMLTILPAGRKMDVQLAAPSTSIGFLHEGQHVLLHYTAYPYQKFGQYWGTVSEVSRAAMPPEEIKHIVPVLPASEASKTFYRITVTPYQQGVTAYGKSKPLEPSMQVKARVLLESRPLYKWILDPLYSVRGDGSLWPAWNPFR